MKILLKRIYESPSPDDGFRILIERLWPRGISKERARVDLWVKDAGASNELRKWFSHDPEKWDEFRGRYFNEIRERKTVLESLRKAIAEYGTVTFLFSARDEDHNNAVALREFMSGGGGPDP